jgi:hypothetical protein
MLPSMVLAAAERATQIDAPGVTRMGQEPNLAFDAMHRAATQFGMGLQD